MSTSTVRFNLAGTPSSFWGAYTDTVRNTVIPYQWETLNDRVPGAEPSHAMANFRIAAGLQSGEYGGMVFQDSDVGKWLEAVAWSLAARPDPQLEACADEAIEIIGKAQAPDGYLNTYFTLKEPGRRWSNLWECHELYSAGHLLEGAVAYYRATGKRKFLDIMIRYVDLIALTFGTGEGQLRGYDGHEEIEMALLRLYEVSKDPKHLALARYFIDERGQEPSFFVQQWEALGHVSHWSKTKTASPGLAYHQSHKPVREQDVAVGHAVRAVYLYAAMAELAHIDHDAALGAACDRLWEDITLRQMYVTGGIGSTHHGEAFSFAYDLPNDTVYAETCASIGLAFFARRMLEWQPHARYADVFERLLYNTVLSSMSLEGKHFFYVNPLEVWPEASHKNPGRHHVKPLRQAWFGCACCPPNLARLVMSLGQYVSSVKEHTLYLHQYVDGSGSATMDGGDLGFRVATSYPRGGAVDIVIDSAAALDCTLALRIPGWCGSWSLVRNGRVIQLARDSDGYVRLSGPWHGGDTIGLQLEMDVQVLEANPLVRADAGKICLQRGPLVYCFEEIDNGPNLSALSLDPSAGFTCNAAPDLPAGTLSIAASGYRTGTTAWDGALYRQVKPGTPGQDSGQAIGLRAIPYYLWGNRKPGEMSVWMRKS